MSFIGRLVRGWSKTKLSITQRSKPTGSKSRQFLRRVLWLNCVAAVNKANLKTRFVYGKKGVHNTVVGMPRRERRNLSRAYFKGAWMKRAA